MSDSERVRKKILESVKSLAQYNMSAWEQVGPGVQLMVIDSLVSSTLEQRIRDRDIVIAACESVLSPEVEGAVWSANSVMLRTGTVPANPEIVRIRKTAIGFLRELFEHSKNEAQRRQVINTLHQVGYSGGRAEATDDLRNLTLSDSAEVVEFFRAEVGTLSYELMQKLEHDYFYDYRRARDISKAKNLEKSHEAAKALMAAIERLRDKFNSDPDFVKFKILVGFESIFPQQWNETNDDKAHDYASLDKYRNREAAKYVQSIDEKTEDDWFKLIEKVAAVESDDLATFPPFARFLTELARAKPEVVARLMSRASERLGGFSAPIFAGLKESGNAEIYEQQLEHVVAEGTMLAALARHLRILKEKNDTLAERILQRAMELKQVGTVVECLIWAMEAKTEDVPVIEKFFEPAIRYLNDNKQFWWVLNPWLAADTSPLFASLSESQSRLLVPALVSAQRLDYRVEQFLIHIAKRYPNLVWEVFEARLAVDKNEVEGRYEAIPYQFHGLQNELSKDAAAAVEFGRRLYAKDSRLFRFRGGRLLSAVFPNCPNNFAEELEKLATSGNEADIKFVLAIMENYHGEDTTHEVLKRLIVRFPDNEDVRTGILISLESTGVVMGEFGFANALREKMAIAHKWQDDPRPEVRAFAERHLRSLELRIADEQRRAEERKALRELEYDSPPEKPAKN